MRIEPELSLILSGIQDVLIQAAKHDGFTPTSDFNWAFFKNNINAAFNVSQETISVDVYDLTNQHPGLWAYECLLFKENTKGEMNCDSDHIYINYILADSYHGYRISAKLRCYMKHPESYRQALIDAGAIITQTSTYETVQCGV